MGKKNKKQDEASPVRRKKPVPKEHAARHQAFVDMAYLLDEIDRRGLELPEDVRKAALEAGLWVQRLYRKGFKHANCGGACVKGGQAQWKLLLQEFPERYARHEAEEQKAREHIGSDVSILRDRTGGTTKPLTLVQLRLRVQAGAKVDEHDWGGCNCFSSEE